MSLITETLKSLSNHLWKQVHLDFEGENKNAYLFNMEKVSKSSVMNDIFGDGLPDDLNLDSKVPFCAIGYIEGDESEFKEGNLDVLAQPEHLLFVDIEDSDKTNPPVYAIEIDGTAIPSTFRRMGNLGDIKIKKGFVTEEE